MSNFLAIERPDLVSEWDYEKNSTLLGLNPYYFL